MTYYAMVIVIGGEPDAADKAYDLVTGYLPEAVLFVGDPWKVAPLNPPYRPVEQYIDAEGDAKLRYGPLVTPEPEFDTDSALRARNYVS